MYILYTKINTVLVYKAYLQIQKSMKLYRRIYIVSININSISISRDFYSHFQVKQIYILIKQGVIWLVMQYDMKVI